MAVASYAYDGLTRRVTKTIGTTMKTLLLIALSTHFIANCCMYEADASSFEDAAHHVVKAVQAKDFKTFVANCSQRGVLVVARYADFKYIKSNESAVFDFNVSDDATLTWADERAHFDRNEIRHSLDFHKLFDQFCEYVGTTYGGAGASTKVWDQWHERMLCDVVSGKMSSNFFWYIYFVKEGGQWKVWRIECAIR